MAKNWTLKEAVQVLAEGTNKEDMMNIGGRFPLLAIAVSGCIAKAGKEFTDFMSYMPDYLTANKMHSMMKAGATTSEETEEETEVEEKVEKKAKAKPAKEAPKETEDEDGSYESMTAMELFKECKNRGIKAEAKKPAKFYIGLLEKDDKKKAKAEPEEEEDWGDDEEPEEKPAKAKKEKPAKEEKKKPAKKAEPEPEETDDDEDDDWDI